MAQICDPKYNLEDGRVKLLGNQWFQGRTGTSPTKIPQDNVEEAKETEENGPGDIRKFDANQITS